MRSGKQISIAWYAVADYIMAVLAWIIFYFIRKSLIKEPITDPSQFLTDDRFWLGVVFIPLGWLFLFALVGSYHSLYKKSRLFEFTVTLVCTLIGSVILFFAILIDDVKDNYYYYYVAFLGLLLIHLCLLFFGRWLLLNKVKKQLLSGDVYFNTLMVGSQDNALKIYRETGKSLLDGGYRYVGFAAPNHISTDNIQKLIPKLGTIDELERIIDEHKIIQVVLALEKSEQPLMESVINRLNEKDVEIKIHPDTLDILSGFVKTNNVLGAVLIDLKTGLMPDWQQHIKRLLDVGTALLTLIILLPVMLYIALRVKLSSPGPVFFSQERI
ncbi:MAG: sugar transferase, partial [Chitinophagaceae bacterium]